MSRTTPGQKPNPSSLKDIYGILDSETCLTDSETPKHLISLMIYHQIFLPSLVHRLVTENPPKWQNMATNLFLVSGSMPQEFTLSQEMMETQFPNWSNENCDESKNKNWKRLWKTLTRELGDHAIKSAQATHSAFPGTTDRKASVHFNQEMDVPVS